MAIRNWNNLDDDLNTYSWVSGTGSFASGYETQSGWSVSLPGRSVRHVKSRPQARKIINTYIRRNNS